MNETNWTESPMHEWDSITNSHKHRTHSSVITEVWGKVIFLHLSVILFIGGLPHCMLGYIPQEQTPPRDQRQAPPPPPGPEAAPPRSRPPRHSACWEIGVTGGRYASYWNAIFLLEWLTAKQVIWVQSLINCSCKFYFVKSIRVIVLNLILPDLATLC